MVATLLRRGTSVIGVDFGACSLRAAQLQRIHRRWCVHHWINIEHEPAGPEPAALDYAAELRLAFGPGTFTGDRTALVLSPPDVEFRLLEVPPAVLSLQAAELRSALQFELERQLPWPASGAEIAAWPIRLGSAANANTMVVAARSESVQRRLDLLAEPGLDCLRADVLPNAIGPLCEPPGIDPAATVWGLLDLGFTSARLYIIHEGCPVYARVIHGGGRELTEALAKALHVEFRIAEQYKRIYGVCRTERGVRSLAGGIGRISEEDLPGVLYAILRPILENMITEIERSYRFALGRSESVTAGPLLLVGGGARMPGLQMVLQEQLGIPASLAGPRPLLEVTSASEAGGIHPACNAANFPALAGCIGMALREEQR